MLLLFQMVGAGTLKEAPSKKRGGNVMWLRYEKEREIGKVKETGWTGMCLELGIEFLSLALSRIEEGEKNEAGAGGSTVYLDILSRTTQESIANVCTLTIREAWEKREKAVISFECKYSLDGGFEC